MSKFLDGRRVSFWVGVQPEDVTQVQYNELPRASGDFEKTRSFTDDETLTSVRESKDSVLTSSSVSGDLTSNLRLSEHYKKLRQGGLQSYDSVIFSVTAALTYTHATTTLAGADFTAISEGQYFGLTMSDSSIAVVRATADGTATDILIAGLTADATATAANAETLKSADNQIQFMIQKRAEGDDGAGNSQLFYRTFQGVEVLQYALSLASESILTETFTMTGLKLQEGETLPAQGADIAYDETQVLGSVKGVESIWFNGEKRGCFAQAFDFSIDNQGEETKSLGQEGACAISYGNPMITGSASLYTLKTEPFEFHKLTDAQTEFPFAFVLKDPSQESRMVVSGSCKATTVDGAPESGPLVTTMGLKFLGNIELTYI